MSVLICGLDAAQPEDAYRAALWWTGLVRSDISPTRRSDLHEAGLTNIGTTLVLGFCYLIIMACFFVMACQVCLAVVEYYLVLTLATCLIPFGMSPHTKFLSEKAIGAVVAVSVKLMVLSFIVSLVSPVLGQLRFSGAGGELKLNEIMSMVLVCGMLALVTWRAPGFASLRSRNAETRATAREKGRRRRGGDEPYRRARHLPTGSGRNANRDR
jgi:P-type conjugative transfer protein TrbL